MFFFKKIMTRVVDPIRAHNMINKTTIINVWNFKRKCDNDDQKKKMSIKTENKLQILIIR